MIFDKVREVIAKELRLDPEKVTLEANLQDDLGADSLDAAEIIMDLEDSFGISVTDDAAESIKTVKDIVDYIEKYQK